MYASSSIYQLEYGKLYRRDGYIYKPCSFPFFALAFHSVTKSPLRRPANGRHADGRPAYARPTNGRPADGRHTDGRPPNGRLEQKIQNNFFSKFF